MNIIKQGDKTKLLSMCKFESIRCGCIFECNNKEYKQETDCHNGSFLRVKCPMCRSDVTADVRR